MTFRQVYVSVFGGGYYDMESSCACLCDNWCEGLTCGCSYAEHYRDPAPEFLEYYSVTCGCSDCKSMRLSDYGIGRDTPLAQVEYLIERFNDRERYFW
jgi:hypothetical protein